MGKKRRNSTSSALMILCLLVMPWHNLDAEDASMQVVQDHVDRCITQYERRNLLGAISELKKALRLRPGDPHLHFMMGNALYRAKDMGSAAGAYAAAVRLNPMHLEARISHGFALFETDDFENATHEWLAAILLNPREPFARAALAVGFYSSGQVEEAKVQYTLAVAMDERYGDPDRLRIDIRWTAKACDVLGRIQKLPRTEIMRASP